MQQHIHILDTDVLSEKGAPVKANCGAEVAFRPIMAHWNDGRVCNECLLAHRSRENRGNRYTLALIATGYPQGSEMVPRDSSQHSDYVGPISDQAGIDTMHEDQKLIY